MKPVQANPSLDLEQTRSACLFVPGKMQAGFPSFPDPLLY